MLANDSDADGDILTAQMPTRPKSGKLALSTDGSFTYTPKSGFTGADTFTYMAHDGNGGMPAATVTVNVGAGGGGGGSGPLSVNDVNVTEGNSGATTNAVFTITRSNGTGAASVKYLTTGGTATAGTDYTAVPLAVVSFAAGETSKTVAVKVLGDNTKEPNETFFVKLSAPTGATIADAKGIGTIVNDD